MKVFIGFLIVTLVFFYKTVFFGYVPFPGDILVSEYQPWRSSSYLGFAPGGIPNKAQYPDTIRQMYPWKTVSIDAIKKGKLPLWNPYNFSGTPLLANFQNAALYPLGLLYLAFSQINAWTVLVFMQPFLACVFTYLYTKKIGLTHYGATLSALSFGFSGFMAVWLEYNTIGHVILWLPLILFTAEQTNKKWLGIVSVANAASLLAGHPQVFAYQCMFTVTYAMFRSKHKLLFIFYTTLGIGLTGIQLLPGLELAQFASRSVHDFKQLFEKILIQPWQLITLVFPNFFGNPATRNYWPTDTFIGKVTTIGIVPLFFLLATLRKRNWQVKFYLSAAIIILILITANPLTYVLYKSTSSSPTLMSFLFAFSLSILCGIGFDHFIVEKHTIKKLTKRTLQVILFFTILIVFVKAPGLRAVLFGGVISIMTLISFWFFIATRFKKPALLLIIVIHIFDLFYFFNKFNPFTPKEFVFPQHHILTYLQKTYDRFWGYGTAHIDANFASQYNLYSPEGYDPLYPKWYGEFFYSYKTGSSLTNFDNATRSDAAMTTTFGDGGLSDPNKRKVLNALSVRYILDRKENGSDASQLPTEYFKRLYEFEDWIIYENLAAKPRAMLPNGEATIVVYEPENIVIQTQSTISGTLTLSDTYYPGWVATLDDNVVPILQSKEGLREVAIPEGNHTIRFSYNPKSVMYGTALSIASLILLFVLVVIT